MNLNFKESALLNQAKQLQQTNNRKEAISLYSQILSSNPRQPTALYNLGIISSEIGDNKRAIELIGQSLQLDPTQLEPYLSLAQLYLRIGDAGNAERCYHMAIHHNERFLDAYLHLGALYREQRLYDKAISVFIAALELDSQSKEAMLGLAILYLEKGDSSVGFELMDRVLAIDPNYAPAHRNIAVFYKELGKNDKAMHHYKRAYDLDPSNADAHGAYIYLKHYDNNHVREDIYRETLDWVKRHTSHITPLIQNHSNDKNPDRRLRIGYVSADFRQHPVANYIEPVLASHNKSECEIFCYSNHAKEDAVTQRIRSHADHWRNILQLSDSAVAGMIQDDAIDILIDLSGFTQGHRLLVFARKPAPIQATWIGYFNTTGLKTMDYIITDRFLLPPEEEHLYVEKPLRLPNSGAVFKAHDLPIEVSTLPTLRNGYITFGCFNDVSKLSPEVIELWARILNEMPTAQLYLKNKSFGNPEVCEQYRAQFVALGIDGNRIRYSGFSPTAEYLACYHEVDLGLDPFPYNGATTTLDSLWMGVPVIALQGDRLVGHIGESLLGAVGLEECIAATKEEYIAKAIRLAKNTQRLVEIRATLRQTMAAAPLTNPGLFTRGLEAAFRDIWKTWCQKQQ